jgi:small subunit ribosomal protein S6
MPFYENIFIARQDVSTAQVEALTEQFVGIIDAQGGKVTKREYWGLKSLTYRIKKNRKGHYVLLNIDAPAAAVIEMERNMHINEDVLRHLTVKVEELEEGPSAMLQSRGRDRDDRGGREGRGDREGGRGGGGYRDRDDRLRPSRGDRQEASSEGEAR